MKIVNLIPSEIFV